ncbi:hypothetical protein HNQ80_002376 [Anaerosolibacter carboniphilus]|uniref:DRTGG domain-containing protein n=1 Tax=Anaerosolibacter carboniphilus TaxID=1417629 RepID=A0A841KS74_9FIRM|nr:hypothetical protein [Anaerosolibacter carboniphilus]MBB6216277.1 hypothetical protein [Anaerosolibacter carboniphilus]
MKLSEIIELLSAKVYTEPIDLDMDIEYGRASDLLSDVLRSPMENSVLLTGLVNVQVIRTAELMDIRAIVLVRDKEPSPEMIELATESNITLLGTEYKLYRSCGLLFSRGLLD